MRDQDPRSSAASDKSLTYLKPQCVPPVRFKPSQIETHGAFNHGRRIHQKTLASKTRFLGEKSGVSEALLEWEKNCTDPKKFNRSEQFKSAR